MKKAKGRSATMVRLRRKLLMISGTRGPMMLVRSEITKKMRKTSPTMKVLLLAPTFIVPPVFTAFPLPASIKHSTGQGNRPGEDAAVDIVPVLLRGQIY
jgi:hypothetical protein